MEIKFIDMFSGIGGFRLGLEKSNGQQQKNPKVGRCRNSIGSKGKQPSQPKEWGNYFSCVWSNDNDRYACQIYRKHFGEVSEQDIRTVDVVAIPEHDLLCAGFPCQSFSIAGKRRGFEDTRGTLFYEICRVIWAKRPRFLLLENVRGLLSQDDGYTFTVILQSLDGLGYDCQWQVLNSKDFGVPQNRERVFIVGHLRTEPRPKVFPIGESHQRITKGDGKGSQTEISPTIDSRVGATVHRAPYIIREQFDVSGKGYGSQQDRIYHTEGIMSSLPASRTENKINIFANSMGDIRRLTPTECERLQGFPDGWTEGISDSQRYKCIGNAVYPELIRLIGKRLLGDIN